MAAATYSAKDLATECGTDGRTIRKFLRSYLPAEDQPGQGGRYTFTKGDMAKIVKAFKSSTKVKTTDTDDTPTPAPKAKTKKGKSKKDKDAVPNFDIGGRADPDEDIPDLEAIDDPSEDEIEEEFEIDDLDD